MYAGFVNLGATIRLYLQTKNASKAPTNATDQPTWRAYGASGVVANGTAAIAEAGVISDASNATPIVITDAAHGLTQGTRITVAGVLVNTAANGSFNIGSAILTASTFSLDGSVGNGNYGGGGSWNTSGLYAIDIVASEGNGFESGQTYTVIATYQISGVSYSQEFTFTVN